MCVMRNVIDFDSDFVGVNPNNSLVKMIHLMFYFALFYQDDFERAEFHRRFLNQLKKIK